MPALDIVLDSVAIEVCVEKVLSKESRLIKIGRYLLQEVAPKERSSIQVREL